MQYNLARSQKVPGSEHLLISVSITAIRSRQKFMCIEIGGKMWWKKKIMKLFEKEMYKTAA